jgi:hypothetical protein
MLAASSGDQKTSSVCLPDQLMGRTAAVSASEKTPSTMGASSPTFGPRGESSAALGDAAVVGCSASAAVSAIGQASRTNAMRIIHGCSDGLVRVIIARGVCAYG